MNYISKKHVPLYSVNKVIATYNLLFNSTTELQPLPRITFSNTNSPSDSR